MEIWAQEFEKQRVEDIAKQIGKYAASDAEECWAEVRVLQSRGEKIPKWAEKAVEKMEITIKDWEVLQAHDPWL